MSSTGISNFSSYKPSNLFRKKSITSACSTFTNVNVCTQPSDK